MKITHLQSSTQIIQLGNVKVLTDPWLTDGEYLGSWYHYPPFPSHELDCLEYDYIYVSHIHPDHLSQDTFKALPKKVPVLIHRYESQFLKFKLEKVFGFEVIECDHGKPYHFENGGTITIFAADNCNPALCGKFMGCAPVEIEFGSSQIDTLALFQYKDESILNTNDCPFELAESTIKKNNLDQICVDVLCVGYGGAGPFPQCFEFKDTSEKMMTAKVKETQFLNKAIQYIELVKPRAYVPFAGTYILGSRLANLNEFRGVPSVQDALSYLSRHVSDNSQGFLLGQFDSLGVKELKKSSGITKYAKSYQEYLDDISKNSLQYDSDEWDDRELPNLIDQAFERFESKAKQIRFISDTTIIIQSEKIRFNLKTNRQPKIMKETDIVSEPFVKITVDHNLLHRLVRGPKFAHWNNAEIGSHLFFDRKPEQFERGLYHSLSFLHS
jgi:UDP-MurNAc hydroxylase